MLDEIGETKGLSYEIEQQKLQFTGHIMTQRCIENDLLTGMVFGKRSRGRQKTRMTNTIKEKLGLRALQKPETERNGRTLCMPIQPFGKPNVLNYSSRSSSNNNLFTCVIYTIALT